MRWHAALPEKGREIVEDCTRKMADQSGPERCDTVEKALDQVLEGATAESITAPEARKLSAGIMIAAILEKLEPVTIANSDDAKRAAASTDLDDQLAACDWLIEQSLASTPPLIQGTKTTLH